MDKTKPLIAESKATYYELHKTDDGYVCEGHNTSFPITEDEYKLLSRFYHVTEQRRAYARATYRKKILEAFGFFNSAELEVRNEVHREFRKAEPSLFHCVFSTFRNESLTTEQLIRGLQLLAKKGNINYISLYGHHLYRDSFDNLDQHLRDIILSNLSKMRSFDRSSLPNEPTLSDLMPYTQNLMMSAIVGFDTLRVIKELRLININPNTIVADYGRYKRYNYLVHQLNNEFTGIY